MIVGFEMFWRSHDILEVLLFENQWKGFLGKFRLLKCSVMSQAEEVWGEVV